MLFHSTHQKGFTLIETIIAIAIFLILSLAMYLVITLGISIVRDDQARLDALSIAQESMEEIRNVPYEDVGTQGGVPSGNFVQTKNLVRNNTTYTVKTKIYYVDDTYDGVAPTDTVNTDYKKIEISVTWQNQFLNQPVLLVTNVSPEGIETSAGGGTLWIEVYTADSTPVVGATVHVTNTQTNPTIDTTGTTDADGRYILPGTPASVESYHVVVSKNGYSSEQTYSVDADTNPNPDPEDLTVIESEIATKIFYIDTLSSINIHVQDHISSTPTANASVHVIGQKRIGTDLQGNDIAKYDQTFTTNSNGDLVLSNIEYDTYTIELADGTTYDFAGSTPYLPDVLPPNSNHTITLLSAPNAAQTLLVTVQDANEMPIPNATVHLYNELQTTDITQTTNASGQTFFTPLGITSFTLDITATGYTPYSGTAGIFSDEQQRVQLSTE